MLKVISNSLPDRSVYTYNSIIVCKHDKPISVI